MEENKTLIEARKEHFIEVLQAQKAGDLRNENDKLRADLEYVSIMAGIEIPEEEKSNE